jgi:hygromycin-B 7''-O-kinase
MFADTYSQPDAPDPVLDNDLVLALVRRHVPSAQAVTAVDESGGEARTYAVDDGIILKVQRPQQLRPRTSLAKEVFFLQQLQSQPAIRVPRVLGYGHDGPLLEYTVLTRMPGRAMRHVQLAEQARQAVLVELGKTLRQIHALPQQPFRESGLVPSDGAFAQVQARFRHHFAGATRRIREQGRQWSLAQSPEQVAAAALALLQPADELVALHSNPGPEHTFVFPESGAFAGLIDFGDAYISHPVLDLRRRAGPQDREAIFRGYTWERPVSASFLAAWQVVQILSDLLDIADTSPERAAVAETDVQEIAGLLSL